MRGQVAVEQRHTPDRSPSASYTRISILEDIFTNGNSCSADGPNEFELLYFQFTILQAMTTEEAKTVLKLDSS